MRNREGSRPGSAIRGRVFCGKLLPLCAGLFLPLALLAQQDRFLTLSNVKARPMAMGGAFVSLQDDLAAISYNPAAFDLYRQDTGPHVTFFLNPVSPVVAAVENSDIFQGNGDAVDDVLLSLSFLVKSVAASWNSFDLAVLLGEERLGLPETFLDEELLSVSGFRQNHTHSLVGRLRLADKISIGAAANLHYQSEVANPDEARSDFGVNYGIWLKPEQGLKVGVLLINLPNSISDYRLPLERLVDESVNVGVSYELHNSMVSVDLRNIGEEQGMAVREVHMGLEQILATHVAIRAGWYNNTNDGQVYSAGVGLIDGNALRGSNRSFGHRNFLLNYAFVYENTNVIDNRWHFLSFYVRL